MSSIKSPTLNFSVVEARMDVPKGRSISEAEQEAVALAVMLQADILFEFNGETYRVAFDDLTACVSKVPKL